MIPPGWNVSEPIQLVFKLYRVAEALRSAPDSAKAFVTKISNFSGNLTELQRILDSENESHSTDDLERLRALVVQCQACVRRCEKYSEGFEKLTKDGNSKMDSAGQAARWTLHEEKTARLREEINGQMNDISLALAVRNLADGRTRQKSHSATSSCNPPILSGTLTSLPPSSSPEPDWAQTESSPPAKTPAQLLGLSHKRVSDTLVPYSSTERRDCNDKGIMASPPVSPNTLFSLAEPGELSELHLKDSMMPLERRRNTMDGFAVFPTGLRNFSALSEASSAASRVFTSPTMSSRSTSITDETNSTSRHGSAFALEHAVMETVMENLSGVQVSYYKDKARIWYPVSTIEAFRDQQNGRRYIIISPPSSSNIRLYLAPPTQRIIPHSEHPQAYGSTQKHKVKFIEQYLLRSQKISLEHQRQPSDASKPLSPSLAPVSSAASVVSSRSCSSPILTVNNGVLKEESRRQEYDFEKKNDYHRFQELLMGPDVTLQLQVPIQSIAAKKYRESKLIQESHLQLLRLWHYDGHQTLMFFANVSSSRYREYRLENLRPVESKSTTTIRLYVHLPGMVRRRSSSKNPLPINIAVTHPDQARLGGCIDENDMTDLDYLSIKFDDSKGRTAFLHEARFHSSVAEPAPSPLLLPLRTPP